jgi:hypothetical protein
MAYVFLATKSTFSKLTYLNIFFPRRQLVCKTNLLGKNIAFEGQL